MPAVIYLVSWNFIEIHSEFNNFCLFRRPTKPHRRHDEFNSVADPRRIAEQSEWSAARAHDDASIPSPRIHARRTARLHARRALPAATPFHTRRDAAPRSADVTAPEEIHADNARRSRPIQSQRSRTLLARQPIRRLHSFRNRDRLQPTAEPESASTGLQLTIGQKQEIKR